jgi:beta-lactam-binding protein with PASTA domain
VTTLAGTANASQQFTYVAPTPPPPPITCKVPKVVKKTLKAAKKAIRKAHCKVGLVSTKQGVKAATGKVVRQSPKAGKVIAAHSAVSLKLG